MSKTGAEDAVKRAVFVVCRGFHDNGDGMSMHNLRDCKSKKLG